MDNLKYLKAWGVAKLRVLNRHYQELVDEYEALVSEFTTNNEELE